VPYHFPGYNYNGPGTHIINNVSNHIPPINKTDFAAMLHDIQYLQIAGLPQYKRDADQLAINNSENNLGGIAMGLGLTIGHLLGMDFTKTNKDPQTQRDIGNALLAEVKQNHPDYFTVYDINPELYRDNFV
jgi:hypothetical protein